MNTNHLQSIKQANKDIINVAQHGIARDKQRIKQLLRGIKESKAYLAKKVDQQKQVKADISSAKVARPAGSRRKHNKSDPRYVAWYTSSHAAKNESVTVKGDVKVSVDIGNIPVAVGCSC